jgi:hypothetical protein
VWVSFMAEESSSRYFFHITTTELGLRYCLLHESTRQSVKYEEFLIQLETNQQFREMLTESIRSNGVESFFWECIPVSFNALSSTSFQFMIIPTHFPDSPDVQSFSDHFQFASPHDTVVSFKNLRGDADLVVPCPLSSSQSDLNHFTHLGSFLRHGHVNQIDELWKKTAEVMQNRLLKSREDAVVWLSTHGKGVYWLHIRLDSEPKYYQCKEFKRI